VGELPRAGAVRADAGGPRLPERGEATAGADRRGGSMEPSMNRSVGIPPRLPWPLSRQSHPMPDVKPAAIGGELSGFDVGSSASTRSLSSLLAPPALDLLVGIWAIPDRAERPVQLGGGRIHASGVSSRRQLGRLHRDHHRDSCSIASAAIGASARQYTCVVRLRKSFQPFQSTSGCCDLNSSGAVGLDVLTLDGRRIQSVTAFLMPTIFRRFGLADQLPLNAASEPGSSHPDRPVGGLASGTLCSSWHPPSSHDDGKATRRGG
jgi:hypothetical protein